MDKNSISSEIKEWVISLITAAILAFLIQSFVIQPYQVEGPSMLPTLVQGERVMVNKFIYRLHPPQKGDIIVFHYDRTNQDFIKRVIAQAGDTVEVRNQQVYVNGQQLNEPYILEPTRGVYRQATIPPGHLFVMGDDRNNSEDSRFSVGFLPLEAVKGQAVLRFWPLNKFTLFNH